MQHTLNSGALRSEFERYAETGKAFIQKLGEAMGQERDPEKSLVVMKAVFSALRAHLSFGESVGVIETLPMAIRGFYADGWVLRSGSPKITTVEDFVAEVGRAAGGLLDNSDEIILAALAVIETMEQFVASEAAAGTSGRLPRGLVNLYNTLIRISSRNDLTLR